MSISPILKPQTLLAGRWHVVSPLKQGGMSNIYIVEDTRLQTQFALKELFLGQMPQPDQQELISIFEREARILSKLRHPSIPRVFDYFSEGNKYYIVMDLIEGDDLESLVQSGTTISTDDTLKMGIEICKILEYLHGQQPPILHRDIKPSNIIQTKDGNLVLIDFGIAGWIKIRTQTNQTAHATVAIGSPGFAPPEQYVGKTDVRSDVYGLGATLHYLLTGNNPESNPFQFSDIPNEKELTTTILKAAEATADRRYQTASEFRRALLEQLPAVSSLTTAGNSITAPPPDKEIMELFEQLKYECYIPRALRYYQVGMIGDAINFVRSGTEPPPLTKEVAARCHYLLARLCESVDWGLKESVESFEKSIQLDPTQPAELAFAGLVRVNSLLKQQQANRKQRIWNIVGGWQDIKSLFSQIWFWYLPFFTWIISCIYWGESYTLILPCVTLLTSMLASYILKEADNSDSSAICYAFTLIIVMWAATILVYCSWAYSPGNSYSLAEYGARALQLLHS